MKPYTFLLLLVATLSCRAQNSAASSAERTESQSTMAAVEVAASAEGESTAPDLKKDLADLRAEQQASMAQTLAAASQKQKATFTGIIVIEQPKLFAPKLSEIAGPKLAFAPAIDPKNSVADISHGK